MSSKINRSVNNPTVNNPTVNNPTVNNHSVNNHSVNNKKVKKVRLPTCRTCGRVMPGAHHNTLYCPPCGQARTVERRRNWMRSYMRDYLADPDRRAAHNARTLDRYHRQRRSRA